MSDLPPTDDQLRQVVGTIAAAAARRFVLHDPDFRLDLHDACEALGVPLADPCTAAADAAMDLIRTATITVDWPDASVRDFAAKLRAELEQLRKAHEAKGLYPAALAYGGAVASLDAALGFLDVEAAA